MLMANLLIHDVILFYKYYINIKTVGQLDF